MESSETTSIASQYYGYIENGRRYQNVKSEQYFMPTGERSRYIWVSRLCLLIVQLAN